MEEHEPHEYVGMPCGLDLRAHHIDAVKAHPEGSLPHVGDGRGIEHEAGSVDQQQQQEACNADGQCVIPAVGKWRAHEQVRTSRSSVARGLPEALQDLPGSAAWEAHLVTAATV